MATALRVGKAARHAFVALCMFGVSSPALSTEVIDQANDNFTPTAYLSILTGYGEGQSFRPSMSSLDFVRFTLALMGFSSTGPVEFVVDLHHESRTNPVLATSAPVSLDGMDPVPATFVFPQTVGLVAQDTYVFILRYTSGQDNWGIGCAPANPYPGGQLIAEWGQPDVYDAWFQEGPYDLTPVATHSWAEVKSRYR